jgi:2-polyprenyl-3-methyl-5-hydroxy-6-metoxy-1,4-benzoquinol methylase
VGSLNILGALALPISKNKRAVRFILRMLMRLHNACYNSISRFAVAAEGGIHPKHRLMNYHAFFTDNVNMRDTVLDIGCGNGFLSYDVAQKAKHVTAIDLSQDNIASARRDFNRDNINYIYGDACQFMFTDKFDVVILSNVLEHIEDRVDFLLRIRELAAKLLIRVPMVNRDWLTYYKRELGVESRLDLTHQTEYTLESLKAELDRAGLMIEKTSIQFGEIWAIAKRKF